MTKSTYCYFIEPLWETQCDYVPSTIKDFEQWQSITDKNGSSFKSTPNNARHLLDIDPGTYWAYADYKHMAELFDEEDEIHNVSQFLNTFYVYITVTPCAFLNVASKIHHEL